MLHCNMTIGAVELISPDRGENVTLSSRSHAKLVLSWPWRSETSAALTSGFYKRLEQDSCESRFPLFRSLLYAPSVCLPPIALTGKRALVSRDKKVEPHNGPHGLFRSMLKLIVEADSSRFLRTRIGATLVLIGLLAAFAGLGYGLPALLSRYF